MAARMHQFAKVPILRDEYALLIHSALQNLLVCRASRDFGNRNHIMARFAQRFLKYQTDFDFSPPSEVFT
jgi:hypothetical protein